MSFNAWPDQVHQDDKYVGQEVVQILEPLVPNVEVSSVHSAGALSRALSAAIESQNRRLGESSHASSDELMRATIEARDAMSSVKDSLDVMPPDTVIDEPMMRQQFPLVPTWFPGLLQRAVGNEVSTLGAGIAEHAAAIAALPVMLEPSDSQACANVMHMFEEQLETASRRTRSEGGGARSVVSGIASAVGSRLGLSVKTYLQNRQL